MQPRMITVTGALIRWSIGKTTLYRLIREGSLRAVKLGSRTLVDVTSGDALFDNLPSISQLR